MPVNQPRRARRRSRGNRMTRRNRARRSRPIHRLGKRRWCRRACRPVSVLRKKKKKTERTGTARVPGASVPGPGNAERGGDGRRDDPPGLGASHGAFPGQGPAGAAAACPRCVSLGYPTAAADRRCCTSCDGWWRCRGSWRFPTVPATSAWCVACGRRPNACFVAGASRGPQPVHWGFFGSRRLTFFLQKQISGGERKRIVTERYEFSSPVISKGFTIQCVCGQVREILL